MSHLVTIQTQVRDPQAIQAACTRMQIPNAVHGTAKLFANEVTGWNVILPGWRYPVVCHTESGQLHFDNYGGRWGEQEKLDAFVQSYAVEKAKLEARKQGHSVSECLLADGSIRVQIALAS